MSQEKIERYDVKHVTCGLVPLMQTHLEGAESDIVELLIHKGIHTELWNAFGSGGEWQLFAIEEELFHDVARFHRVEQDKLDPLGLMDF